MNGKFIKGHISAFFTIFVWAATFISIKLLLADFTPIEIMLYRLILAYLVLLAASPRFIKFNNLKEELLFLGAGLCGVTLYFIFQNSALSLTQASNVSVLISISPFFTAIFSRFFAKEEQFKSNFFFGFGISIIGIFLIGFNGNFILKLNPLGDILAILSAIVWAGYTVIMKKISLSELEHNSIHAENIFLWAAAASAFFENLGIPVGSVRIFFPAKLIEYLIFGCRRFSIMLCHLELCGQPVRRCKNQRLYLSDPDHYDHHLCISSA